MGLEEQKIRNDGIAKHDEGVGLKNVLAVWKDNFDKVREIVDSMQPDKVEAAAGAYGKLAEQMNVAANLLYKQGARMAESWGGEDAKKALENLNKTYRQAQEIARVSETTGKALTAHAKTQHGWKNSYGSGSKMDGWVDDAFNWGVKALAVNPASAGTAIHALIGKNIHARQVMNDINNGTVQSNNNFPPTIRKDLASVNIRDVDPIDTPRVNGGGPPGSPKMPGGPGKMPGGPGDLPGGNPGGPDGPGAPNFPDGPNGPGGIPGGPGGPDLPGGPGGPGGPELPGGFGGGGGGAPGTDLANLPGGGPGLGGGGGGPGSAPSSGPGLGGGGGIGSGPGALGGAMGIGPGGFGPGAGAIGKNGPAGFGPGAGALGKNGLGGMSGMGMPMGAGASGGGDNNEHERSTWLSEDADVWGGDDETAPPVIG